MSTPRALRLISAFALYALAADHSATAQRTLNLTQIVRAADPELTWSSPSGIPFGTALGPAQLNAQTSAPGKFVYVPASETILPAGDSVLQVTFIPETSNYLVATAQVSIHVAQPGSSSFTVKGPSDAQFEPIVVGRNEPGSILLFVSPIGDFHQPISFACGETQPSVVCRFSPQVVRPVDSPLPVTLTIRRPDFPALHPSSQRLPLGASLLAAFAIAGFWRKQTTCGSDERTATALAANRARTAAMVLFTLALASTLSSCGSGFTMQRLLPVVASSLVQSRTVYVSYISVGE